MPNEDESVAKRWTMLRAILGEASQVPAGERVAFLRSRIDDPGLLAEAEQLLAFDKEAAAIFAVTNWRETADNAPLEHASLIGTTVGQYRILQEIGRGGMGAVYLAERADGAYEQRVAIKFLQESIFSPEMEKRFLSERQILASLVHPGIARLLDGGVTAGGTPYLVLEYVEGRPLDQYCDENGLDIPARLRLFLKVAEGIQAAHQQLVLHLDLKPANILITNDGEPQLLDFGIARILGDGGLTQPSLMLMTPRYASPEQAEGKPLGVSSDVFSLATLLYRLLTGALPYPIENATPLEAARMIRETVPVAPSKAAAEDRASELRGDLDLIVLQALRKEPERRYPTVAAFAEDIQRYLTSRPVLAHKDSFNYRSSKFLRRNWISVTATAIVLIAIGTSAVLAMRSAREARRQRAVAESRLQDVRALANSFIGDLIPLQTIPGTLEVRKRMFDNALHYLAAMSAEQSNDPKFTLELASTYYQLGQYQGSPDGPSFGDEAGALKSYDTAITLYRRLLDANPDDADAKARIAVVLLQIASVRASQGDIVESKRLHDESWELSQPALRGPKTNRFLQAANGCIFQTHNFDTDNQWNFADPDQAIVWTDRSTDLMEQFIAAKPEFKDNLNFVAQLAYAQVLKAGALIDLGREDEALAIYQKEIPYVEGFKWETNRTLVVTRRMLRQDYSELLLKRGDLEKATEVSSSLHPTINTDTKEGGDNRWDDEQIAVQMGWLAEIDLRNNRTNKGRDEMQQSLAASRRSYREKPDRTSSAVTHLHHLLRFADNPKVAAADARAMYEEAIPIAAHYTTGHPTVLSSQVDEARARVGLVRLAKAAHDTAMLHAEADKAEPLLTNVSMQRPHYMRPVQMLRELRTLRE